MPAKKSSGRAAAGTRDINSRTSSGGAPSLAAGGIQVIVTKGKPVHQQQTFTGRLLIRLDPTVSLTTIVRQARQKSLRLARIKDFPAGETFAEMLTQSDGIILERLRIAVVGKTGAGRVKQLLALHNGPFLSSEPERRLGLFQPERKGGADRVEKGGADLAGTSVSRREKGRAKLAGNSVSRRDKSGDKQAGAWGIRAINARKSRFSGKGVKVAVLDTGIDLAHPDFAGRTIHRKSFAGTKQARDMDGHGSHCAGVLCGGGKKTKTPYSVAPDVRLYIGKILDDAGEGSDGLVLAGIEWALGNGCRIISLSMGAPVGEEEGWSAIFEEVARAVMAHNCLLVAAAGNESQRRRGRIGPVAHPANCPSVLAVGALTESLKVSDYSCAGVGLTGGQIDIAGPGDNILSVATGGGHRLESGTSMATPFVAGVAALLWEQYPKASAGEIWARLTQQAQRLTLPASDVGAGLVYVRGGK